MRKIVVSSTVVIGTLLAFAAAISATPAQAAGVARTFLSAAGSDSNNCANVMTPCRHLATAFAATAADGEIYVLDPANYGSLIITRGVSIEGHGWASIAPPGASSAAITVNANTGDKINIVGVVLDGTAIANTAGILFNSGGSLIVRDSVIRNFQEGIDFQPNASGVIFVSNTLVSDNVDGTGIFPSGDSGVLASISRVEVDHNSNRGIVANGGLANGDASIFMTVADSTVAGNAIGVEALSTSGHAAVTAMVRNSSIVGNGSGLLTDGPVTMRVAQSTITENGFGAQAINASQLSSYGDNDIDGNTTDGAPTIISHK